jgi:hypothetical protein
MRVVFVENTDPIFIAVQMLAARSADECFSARELAATTGITPVAALQAIEKLCETDWCFRETSDASPLTFDERWGLINKSLTPGREYEVLGIADEYYRVLNDPETPHGGNESVLFHRSCFQIVDPLEPIFWDCRTDEEGARYCTVPEWSKPGFFEDYFDRVVEVQKGFWADLQRYYSETWQERKGAA